MDNFLQAFLMVLQGVATSVIDVFFVLAAAIAFMTHLRAGQFRMGKGSVFRRSASQTAETLVQGILGGLVISVAVVALGVVLPLSEGLFLLLPLAFVIGFFHIRYTNMIYSGLIVGIMSYVLNGQTVFGRQLPVLALDLPGMLVILGLLYSLMALLMLIGGQRYLSPIVVQKGKRQLLGFYGQRFWPVPIVLLLSLTMVVTGETVSMPDWWPLLPLATATDIDQPLVIFPMLFIMSQGSVSFTKSPKVHHQYQIMTQGMMGGLMLIVGLAFRWLQGPSWPLLMLLAIIGFVPDILWHNKEEGDEVLYDLAEGLFVGKVKKDSLSQQVGFQLGDQILDVNGQKVHTLPELIAYSKAVEGECVFSIKRDLGNLKILRVSQADFFDQGFGLGIISNQSGKAFDYDKIINMGMMHLLTYRHINKDQDL